MSDFVSSVEFQMSLLLALALGGYILAAKIRQSSAVGAILMGIVIGPGVLGLVTYTGLVQNIAQLGVVILLFVIGLEFKIGDIVNARYASIAAAGVAFPWVLGFLVAQLFGMGFSSSIFIGVALTATSIAITASVMKEMGRLHTDVAKAIIGAAVIDDVLSILILSASSQIVHGSFDALAVSLTFVKAVAFLGVGYFVASRFVTRLIEWTDRTELSKRFPEFAFVMAMMFAFVYATAAELVGLSAIIGSFIAGVALGNVALRHSKNYKEGAEYLHIIFASIFFISLGILADFRVFDLNTVLFLLVLTGAAIVGKVCGCGMVGRLQGMSKKDATFLGFGMSPRGEVTMIIALIGLTQGLFTQSVYVSLVMMSLITTIITPVVLRRIFSDGKEPYKYRRGFLGWFGLG